MNLKMKRKAKISISVSIGSALLAILFVNMDPPVPEVSLNAAGVPVMNLNSVFQGDPEVVSYINNVFSNPAKFQSTQLMFATNRAEKLIQNAIGKYPQYFSTLMDGFKNGSILVRAEFSQTFNMAISGGDGKNILLVNYGPNTQLAQDLRTPVAMVNLLATIYHEQGHVLWNNGNLPQVYVVSPGAADGSYSKARIDEAWGNMFGASFAASAIRNYIQAGRPDIAEKIFTSSAYFTSLMRTEGISSQILASLTGREDNVMATRFLTQIINEISTDFSLGKTPQAIATGQVYIRTLDEGSSFVMGMAENNGLQVYGSVLSAFCRCDIPKNPESPIVQKALVEYLKLSIPAIENVITATLSVLDIKDPNLAIGYSAIYSLVDSALKNKGYPGISRTVVPVKQSVFEMPPGILAPSLASDQDVPVGDSDAMEIIDWWSAVSTPTQVDDFVNNNKADLIKFANWHSLPLGVIPAVPLLINSTNFPNYESYLNFTTGLTDMSGSFLAGQPPIDTIAEWGSFTLNTFSIDW